MSPPATSHENDNRKMISPLGHVIDLVLAGVFFLFMQRVCYAHTPDTSEKWKQILAAYTAVALTGVFWLVLQGLRVTLVDQIRRKKAGLHGI
jgi:hypothetical protein